MAAVLEAKEIAVRIQGKTILEKVSLRIEAGRRTAILGPNGSGKSTILKALAGLLPCAAGEVFFAGEPLAKIGKKRLSQRLAVLPQGSGAPADLTVGELVDYGRFPHRNWWGGDPAADRQAVAEALARTGLAAMKERLVATLSGGERQRAFIAMALAQSPEVLLLDEPTTYLDIAHQLEVMKIVSSLNAGGAMTVVMVLHDMYHAARYADEIVVVKEGAIVASGPPREVISAAMLRDVFGVKAEVFLSASGKEALLPVDANG